MSRAEPTLRQVITELQRERNKRADVYPHWIRKGTIRKEVAAHRLACLDRAIAALRSLADPSELFRKPKR